MTGIKLSPKELRTLLDRLPDSNRLAIEAALEDSGNPSKYSNRIVIVGSEVYHSEGEYLRACDLRVEQRLGLIRYLKRQVGFPVFVRGILTFTYFADFTYERKEGKTWTPVVEDFKGYRTPMYKLKKRIIEALHGWRILETSRKTRRSDGQRADRPPIIRRRNSR